MEGSEAMSAPAMNDRLVLALAQINPTMGDVAGNRDKLLRARDEAKKLGCDLVIPGELALSGYPPEDLVLKPAFLDALASAVDEIVRATSDGEPKGDATRFHATLVSPSML